MRWVRDLTGRFPERPHFDPGELDFECEQIVSNLLREKYGGCKFPVSTDALTIMVERDTSDLDLYADLSAEGEDIEGVTDFFPSKKPAVRIAKDLSLQGWREHRLRTTLTHEYGHVKFHGALWRFSQPSFFLAAGSGLGPRCKRATILDAPVTDWMEWQAGYICGALLMPVTQFRMLVQNALREWRLYNGVVWGSDHAQKLISRVSESFDVSTDAAKVRLIKLNYLLKQEQRPPLF